MSQHSNLNEALGVLDDQLRSLETLTKANSFLVEILRNERAELEAMDAATARRALTERAVAAFGPDAGHSADPDTLEVLINALQGADGTQGTQGAQIIPFPGGRRTLH
ncbi:hypothetical protein [Phaeobacter sp.]|uniref:hypothetical protein n=1 Tax=Phaeobacter sp. TaxID=1902409 RepID=UPI0025DE8012|nr:hypothetical protein [Phaeobacter sp.]